MSTAAAFYADPMPSDDQLVVRLLEQGKSNPSVEAAIDRRASDYINASVRNRAALAALRISCANMACPPVRVWR